VGTAEHGLGRFGAWRSEETVIAVLSSAGATVIGLAFLLAAIVLGFAVGPKWWNWGTFIVLTLVLFIPLALSLFIPLPMVILLNVVLSHHQWLKKHGQVPMRGITTQM